MNEPSVFDSPKLTMPLTACIASTSPDSRRERRLTLEIHNVYGMENCARNLRRAARSSIPNQRPFVLTRASYAGAQRYASTWTGDNSSTWNHLRLTTPMLENLGLSGFAITGADVGGYAGTPPPELLTKWFEIGDFSPSIVITPRKIPAIRSPGLADLNTRPSGAISSKSAIACCHIYTPRRKR